MVVLKRRQSGTNASGFVAINALTAIDRLMSRSRSLTPTDGSLDFLTGDHYFKLQTLSWT